jgi:hypothetical protein
VSHLKWDFEAGNDVRGSMSFASMEYSTIFTVFKFNLPIFCVLIIITDVFFADEIRPFNFIQGQVSDVEICNQLWALLAKDE